MKNRIGLIWAQASNGVIGRDGIMPWHLPEDLAHFKSKTTGGTVIMGRKTWDSIPEKFRPLPGRRNIVITRQAKWRAKGAETASSLQEALTLSPPTLRTWVIGGAETYAQALPFASTAVITEIENTFSGDAYAPMLGPEWVETEAGPWQLSQSGLRYRFITRECQRSFADTHAQNL